MAKTVILILDAFKSDYVTEENTPFLYDLSFKSIYATRLKPGPGFCERTEILTGLPSIKNNLFTALGYNPKKSPFNPIEKLLRIVEFLTLKRTNSVPQKYFRKLLTRFSKTMNWGMGAYRIPLNQLSDFYLAEDSLSYHDLIFSNENFSFEKCLKAGKVNMQHFTSLAGKSFSGSEEVKLKNALNSFSAEYTHDFVYLPGADICGHKYGPKSAEVIDYLNLVDKNLEVFYLDYKSRFPDGRLIIIGDHGMTPVTSTIDVEKELISISKKHNLTVPKYFLDSTYVRFWFDDNSLEWKELLNKSCVFKELGRFYSCSEYENVEIPNENVWGEFLWAASPGVLVWPDFFHNDIDNPPLGMHGYMNDHSDKDGFMICNDGVSVQQIASLKLHEVYKYL